MRSNSKIKSIFVFWSILLILITLSLSTTVFAGQYSIKELTISGGTIGGGTNLMANALSAIAVKYLGVNSTVLANATMAQVNVLQDGQAEISTAMAFQTYDAYKGIGDWKDKPFPDVRLLLPGDANPWHMAVLKNSDIYDIKDLVGKRVVVGKAGFTAEFVTKQLFKDLDMDYDKIIPSNLGHEDAAAALLSGKVDAYIIISSPPQATFTEITRAHDIRIIGLTEEEIAIVIKKAELPGVKRYILPAGIYKGNDEDILTPDIAIVYSCIASLPEDFVYGLVKNFWENLEFAALQWAKVSTFKIEDIQAFTSSAPWHIGAYKYYKEKGLVIPENMIPPEAK